MCKDVYKRQTLASAEESAKGTSVLERLFSALDLSDVVLNKITSYILPTTTIWTDPFGGLMSMGQTMIDVYKRQFSTY